MSTRPANSPYAFGSSPAPSSVVQLAGSVSAASVLSPPVEISRQLDLFTNEHLARLETLADEYFNGIDSALTPSADDSAPFPTTSRADAHQALLTLVNSMLSAATSSGLGALPFIPPTTDATSSADPAAATPLPPSLNEFTETLGLSVQDRFGRRMAVKDAAAVSEGVLKRG